MGGGGGLKPCYKSCDQQVNISNCLQLEEEESRRPDWRFYQLKKSKKSPEKKMSRKAKRLAKAKAGKILFC